ncbi:MAG: prepilin-type N-terminal cleavage/methylation domain-containing protein [Candidatus Rokubacteria bacterium]|nr:prepilin-type N-terminal cleavage/methylation domain-containing protein [Candidatus Rokubacteria bacterium]
MHARRTAAGFTLVELLVSMALAGLLLAATFTVLHAGLDAYRQGADRLDAQQAARVALERIATELREAGYDPRDAGLPAIVLAEPARVGLARDLDGDGVLAPTRERVTYFLDGAVLRRDAGGGAQPIAEDVRGFALEYRDGRGAPTVDAGAVASVRIRLDVGGGGAGVIMETRAHLRNARGGGGG